MTEKNDGRHAASSIIEGSPDAVRKWLAKAKLDRGRWRTRLFEPSKRRFLDGFIATIESHLRTSDK
jgi:hypothetical protein